MKQTLIEQLNQWHEEDDHQQIVDAHTAISSEKHLNEGFDSTYLPQSPSYFLFTLFESFNHYLHQSLTL